MTSEETKSVYCSECNNEMPPCANCYVPTDLHGTCCGWVNASVKVTAEFIIIDKRHPGYGQNLNSWKQNQFKDA